MQNVKIEVLNKKIQEEPIEVVYMGNLEEKDGYTSVTYEESALTGMEGVFTKLHIDQEEMVLFRTGNIESKMIFRKDHKDVFVYKMEVGSMSMAVETKEYSIQEEEGTTHVYIRYRLDIAGDVGEENEMNIHITKKT